MPRQLTGPAVFHTLSVIALVAVSFWAWGSLPEDMRIPTHWNAAGEVDGYSSKAVGLFLVPGISLGLLVLFAVIPYVEPRRRHLAESGRAYGVLWALMAAFMAVMHAFIIAGAFGAEPAVERWLPSLLGGVFLALGYVMPEIKSNFMFGIRTPWTLTSELAWRKTHTLGRWVFGAVGAGLLLLGLAAPGETAFWGVMIAAVGSSLVLVGYSYWVWRSDPARVNGAGAGSKA